MLGPFALLLFYCIFRQSNSVIEKICLTETSLLLHGYGKDKKRKCDVIKLDNIESCVVTFEKQYDFASALSEKDYRRGGHQHMLKIDININCKNGQTFSAVQDFVFYPGTIKKIFKIAKHIPNFSYQVKTSSDLFANRIKKYAEIKSEDSCVQTIKKNNPRFHVNIDKKGLRFVLGTVLFITLLLITVCIRNFLISG